MIDLTIKTESEPVKKALTEFFKSYKSTLCDYLNLELRDSGYLADSYVVFEGDTIIVYQVTPEKGYVLGEIDDITKWEVVKWSDLEEDKLYIKNTKEGLTMFIKSEKGIPDVKIGQFISIDDAVTQVSSPRVQEAILAARESKKQQLKQIKKLKKLGKAPLTPLSDTSDEATASRVEAESLSIDRENE